MISALFHGATPQGLLLCRNEREGAFFLFSRRQPSCLLCILRMRLSVVNELLARVRIYTALPFTLEMNLARRLR